MKLCVIPARGGSKRIPRKNIKTFYGRPMLAWSIEVAKASRLFDHIIVSTDDAEVVEVSKQWGAEVPFMRPESLSTDYVGITPVIAHAAQWALSNKLEITAICCISATAPFLRADDVSRGWNRLDSGEWDYTFAATDFASSIFRSFKKTIAGGVEMFFPDYFSTRSQDFPVALHDAGQFYWGRPVAWIENKRVFDIKSSPIVIPRWRVQDIDTEEDWVRAEILAPTVMNQPS